jgi:RNA 2',3'-cyclic 3'-phosphodiesterase
VRAFVAVEVAPPGRDLAGGTPSTPEHVTLRFLGEIDERVVEGLVAALTEALASVEPFEFVIDGIGAFPSTERPRVVWRAVTAGRPDLEALARRTRAAIARAGGGDDTTPFVAHVTLFRVRSPRDRDRARELLAPGASLPPAQTVRVREAVLVESTLAPRGAVHRVRARFPLGGASR